MNAAAQVTTDDGDKVNHGWSQLDIAKHSTNTFVASLEDEDYVSVVTYSDGATVRPPSPAAPPRLFLRTPRILFRRALHVNSLLTPPFPLPRFLQVLLPWTQCTSDGRDKAIASIHSMRPERSTNLMAGITTGFSMFDNAEGGFNPGGGDAALSQYALSLIITTDGMPSSQWHPARGRDGYAPLVKTLTKGLTKKRGPSAVPEVTTIGIGFQLDSELLTKMSSTFLHMPDPGQIGPFIVNLLACVRSTARLPTADGKAANAVTMHVTPADAVVEDLGVPGYGKLVGIENNGEDDMLAVPLGSMMYDQPRHLVLKVKAGKPFSLSLTVSGDTVASCQSADAQPADDKQTKLYAVQSLRLAAIDALDQAAIIGIEMPGDATSEPLKAALTMIRSSPHANVDEVKRLGNTLEKEALLGCEMQNFRKWGSHYFRTLPCMLRAERRSNFRDECLQHFGHDARNREGLFEEQSNQAEMRFATLAPPEPSLLRPQPTVTTSYGGGGQPLMAAPPPRPTVLPDEFMRGGGCFAPEATVVRALADGESMAIKVSEVVAGDYLLGEGGQLSRVACVVRTECAGGKAQLTRLPNGTELTEWHPIRDQAGRWRFPHMLGQRVIRTIPYVYNLVLQPGHPTVLVGGIPCAALGHGLDAPVVAHPYWGTDAVIRDLMGREGWSEGRVTLQAQSAAMSA